MKRYSMPQDWMLANPTEYVLASDAKEAVRQAFMAAAQSMWERAGRPWLGMLCSEWVTTEADRYVARLWEGA